MNLKNRMKIESCYSHEKYVLGLLQIKYLMMVETEAE